LAIRRRFQVLLLYKYRQSAIFLFPVYLTYDLEHVSHAPFTTGIIFTKFEIG